MEIVQLSPLLNKYPRQKGKSNMELNNVYDVIIIGAGIIGTSIARELSKYNTRVLILEKEADISMGTTKANSAIVHGGYAEIIHY